MTHPPTTAESSNNPLERMTVNKLATALVPDCFEDCEKLVAHPVTVLIAPQL